MGNLRDKYDFMNAVAVELNKFGRIEKVLAEQRRGGSWKFWVVVPDVTKADIRKVVAHFMRVEDKFPLACFDYDVVPPARAPDAERLD